MAAATATRGLALGLRPRRDAHRDPRPGRATLEDRITALWSRLVQEGEGECPVCRAEMRAARPCGGCGSELS